MSREETLRAALAAWNAECQLHHPDHDFTDCTFYALVGYRDSWCAGYATALAATGADAPRAEACPTCGDPTCPYQTPAPRAEAGGWWCTTCGDYVNGEQVTHDERHDERCGGCGKPVGDKPRVEACPRCGSPDPRKHPAVQFEGEVHECPDQFHRAEAGEEPGPNAQPEAVPTIEGMHARVNSLLAERDRLRIRIEELEGVDGYKYTPIGFPEDMAERVAELQAEVDRHAQPGEQPRAEAGEEPGGRRCGTCNDTGEVCQCWITAKENGDELFDCGCEGTTIQGCPDCRGEGE